MLFRSIVKNGPLSLPPLIFGLNGKRKSKKNLNERSAGAAPSAHPEDAPLIDVLIDGPYVEAENDGVCALRGSTNQRVIVLNPALETLYHEEMQKPRSVQNAVFDEYASASSMEILPSAPSACGTALVSCVTVPGSV